MVLKNLTAMGVILAGVSLFSTAFAADATQGDIDALKKQIKALERKLNNVQAVQNKEIKEVKAKQEAVEVSFENGRPIIRTGDGNNEMAFRGRMHFDMATYRQNDTDGLPSIAPGRDLNEGGNFRRSEISIEGKFMRDFEYLATYDFGGSGNEGSGGIKNMFLGYTGIKPLRIQIGAIQVPMTMDDSTSSNEISFIERATAANLATSFGAQKGRTAVGARGATSNIFGSLYYTRDPVVLGTNTALTGATFDESSNLVGRAAYLYAPNPDTNIHFGASGTKVFHFSQAAAAIPGVAQTRPTFDLRDRPELRVDGARLISTGAIPVEDGLVFGPEFGANWKNFYIQGEYYRYQLERASNIAPIAAVAASATASGTSAVPAGAGAADFDFAGWYVQGSWILTGETKRYDIKNASFGAPRPNGPLGFGDSFGAVELAVRYSSVDLNDGDSSATCDQVTGAGAPPVATVYSSCIRGGEQNILTLGLNWYPNRNVRFMLNYLFVDVDRQAYTNNAPGTGGVAGGPNAQLGQNLDSLALRSQFNF